MSTDLPTEASHKSASPEQRFLAYARTGDKAIVQELIMEFADRAFTQARRIIGRKDGAEDAVQNAYLRLVHTAKKYDGTVPFTAWLGRLVSAAAINYRQRHLSRQINLSDMGDQGAAVMNTQISAENVDTPEVEAVRSALDTLPDHYRTPLTLYYFGGLNQAETAQALGASAGTVAKQLARGLEQLREKLGRAGLAFTSAGLLAMFSSLPTYSATPSFKASLVASERLMATGRHISHRFFETKSGTLLKSLGIFKAGVIASLIAGAAIATAVYRNDAPDFQAAPAPSEPGLVAHWTFDEGQGSTVKNSAGDELTGTLVNKPEWIPGKIGGALSFDGVSNYVTVPSSAALNSLKEQMTVAAWVLRKADLKDFGSIISRRTGPAYEDVWTFYYDNADALYSYNFGITTNNGLRTALGKSSGPDLNTWVHIVGVYDGANVRLYRNGILVSYIPCTTSIVRDNTPIVLGASDAGTIGITHFLNGAIDDVRLYNRALSENEIASLAQISSATASEPPLQQP
jgi:RNA polymerase sigma factor (sigma-70 family)